MPVCDHCGADTDRFRYTCNWCELTLCPDCRLPENHDCDGTDQISNAHRPMGPNDTGLTLRGGSTQPTPPEPEGAGGYTGGGLGWRWRLRRWGSKLWTILYYFAIVFMIVGTIFTGIVVVNETVGDDIGGPIGEFLDGGADIVGQPAFNQSEARQTLAEEIVSTRNESLSDSLQFERHDQLDQSAQEHAEDMIERDFYGHINPDGVGPQLRAGVACTVSEIIAQTYWTENVELTNGDSIYTDTPENLAQSFIDSWLSSPNHRSALLDPFMYLYGVGVAHDPQTDDVFAVVMFCTLMG